MHHLDRYITWRNVGEGEGERERDRLGVTGARLSIYLSGDAAGEQKRPRSRDVSAVAARGNNTIAPRDNLSRICIAVDLERIVNHTVLAL